MKPANNPDPFDFDIFASVSDSSPPAPPSPPIDMRALRENARQNVERSYVEWQARLEIAIPAYWDAKPLRSRESLSPVEVAQMRVVAHRLRKVQEGIAKVLREKPHLASWKPGPSVFISNDAGLWAARDVITLEENTFLLRHDDSRDFFAQWPDVEPLGYSSSHHTFQTWGARRACMRRWNYPQTEITLVEKLMREHGGQGEYWIQSCGSYIGPLAADNTDSLWHWDGAQFEFVEDYACIMS